MPPIDQRTPGVGRALAGILVAWPKTVLLLFLAGTAALGIHARDFRIDAGADTLLTQGNTHYIQTKVIDRRFASQEFLLVAYQPRNWSVLSEKTFADLRELTVKLKQLDRVESVRSILNVPLLSSGGGLAAAADLPGSTLERRNFSTAYLKQAFAGHPIYEDLLINKAQTATTMQVLFKADKELATIENKITRLQQKSLDQGLTAEEREALKRLNEEAEPIKRRLDQTRADELETIRDIQAEFEDDADIYLGGIHVLGSQLVRIITSDLAVFGAAISAMICLVLFFVFRKLRWVAIPMLCCACSVLSTLGLFGLVGYKATVISSSFIALQLILTLAIVVHLIVQYREYSAANADWTQAQLVTETLVRKAGPCFYAGFINIVGFASLIFSSLQPVIDFGWMMSIAMLFSIAVSLILFPALMALFEREPAVSTKPRSRRAFSRVLLDTSTTLSQKHPGLIVMASLGLLAASGFGMLLLDVENSFINYFRDSTKVHQELTFIDRELGGTTPLDLTYTIPANQRKTDLVLTAASVQQMQRIQASIQQHPAVGKILSVVNVTELAKDLNANKPLTEYELTTLYLLMDANLRDDLLGSFFSRENSQVRFAVRIKDTTPGLNRSRLLADIHGYMQKLGIAPEQYKLTGLYVLYEDLLHQLFTSQILTLGITFAVLALAILLIFRSMKIALICITPNVLATLMVLGLMGLLGIPLDFMTIMIASIAMGITVDDTIHYIHRYREELRTGTAEEAVARTNTSVGYALLYTSLIVILGFSLLGFSDFIPSVLFGLLTALAMALAVLFNLTLLPALLNKFVRSVA